MEERGDDMEMDDLDAPLGAAARRLKARALETPQWEELKKRLDPGGEPWPGLSGRNWATG